MASLIGSALSCKDFSALGFNAFFVFLWAGGNGRIGWEGAFSGLVGFGCLKHFRVGTVVSSLHHGMALVYQLRDHVSQLYLILRGIEKRRRKTGRLLVDLAQVYLESSNFSRACLCCGLLLFLVLVLILLGA